MMHPNDRRRRQPRPPKLESTHFPLQLEMRYTVTDKQGSRITGFCHTISLSSSELAFTADRQLMAGQRLEVAIDWPVLLEGGVRLQLVLTGEIVRATQTMMILGIERHEFRTRRFGPMAVEGPDPAR